MSALLDTSVLIDLLRGNADALRVIEGERKKGRLYASTITQLELLAGMRSGEDDRTRALIATMHWEPVDEEVAEEAGRLGRQWLPSYNGIGAADLAIAATATLGRHRLLTMNIKRFPMFPDLVCPYPVRRPPPAA